MTDFAGLIRRLATSRVDFIIVGGVAAGLHGSARTTYDLDVLYARTPDNLRRLVAALSDVEPYLRGVPPGLPFHWSPETLAVGLNFTLTTRAGDIDLLGEIAGGGSYEQLLPHSIDVELFGENCRVVSLPKLIALKRAAGRPRDFDAIAELEALLDETER